MLIEFQIREYDTRKMCVRFYTASELTFVLCAELELVSK